MKQTGTRLDTAPVALWEIVSERAFDRLTPREGIHTILRTSQAQRRRHQGRELMAAKKKTAKRKPAAKRKTAKKKTSARGRGKK